MSPTERFGPIDEQVRLAAADWFARMRGPDAEKERAAFQAWYATPAHARAYEQMVGRWEQSAFIGASSTGRERQLRRAPLGARHPALSAAAAFVAIAGGTALILAFYRAEAPPASARRAAVPLRLASGPAIAEVALADGSRVTLDKASLMFVYFSPARRAVRLASGRARFQPVADPRRPFFVQAGASETRADGGLFDVELHGRDALVRAVEGSVAVRSRARLAPARLLLAHQQILISDGAPLPRPVAARAGDWLPRMIRLDHTSLADAAAQVGRDAPIKILFLDDTSALQVTGTFRSGDLDGLARAAQALFHLKRSRDSGGNILLARDPAAVQK